MAPVVDLSNVELQQFDALPNGTYRVSVERAEMREAASGSDNVFWLLRVVQAIRARSFDGDLESLENRTIAHGTSLQEKALWNFVRTVTALGADPDDLGGELDINDEYVGQFIDKEAIVTLTQREYQGEMQNQVQNIRALTEEEVAAAV